MTLEEAIPLVGTAFLVRTDENVPPIRSLVLAEATGDPNRPYTLIFEGDSGLEQRTYWLSVQGEPAQPIFLVPIALNRYEAVFN
jgi:hypothetical protein